MNTNEIRVITFSIFGVPGFKTAYVTGANPMSRMRSAMNNIHRTMKKMVEVNSGASTPQAGANLCQAIIDDWVKTRVYTPFKDIVEVETISTDEFFKRAPRLFDGNTTLFYERVEEMSNEAENQRRQHKAMRSESGGKIEIPDCFLITCTGGIFATQPNFPVLISSGAISLATDTAAVVREICSKHLVGVKGFCLTDMANAKTAERLNAIKETILEIDKLYGMLDDITVVNHGTMLFPLTPRNVTKATMDERSDAVRYVEYCSTSRLQSFINSITVDLKDSGVFAAD